LEAVAFVAARPLGAVRELPEVADFLGAAFVAALVLPRLAGAAFLVPADFEGAAFFDAAGRLVAVADFRLLPDEPLLPVELPRWEDWLRDFFMDDWFFLCDILELD